MWKWFFWWSSKPSSSPPAIPAIPGFFTVRRTTGGSTVRGGNTLRWALAGDVVRVPPLYVIALDTRTSVLLMKADGRISVDDTTTSVELHTAWSGIEIQDTRTRIETP